jgi:hypothetical protein
MYQYDQVQYPRFRAHVISQFFFYFCFIKTSRSIAITKKNSNELKWKENSNEEIKKGKIFFMNS